MNSVNVSDALCNLLPFVQFKKREKHPWRKVCNFTIGSTPPWIFFHVFKIAQVIPNRAKHQILCMNFEF